MLKELWRKLWPQPATRAAHIDGFLVASELKKLGGGHMKVRIKETGEVVHVPRDPIVELMIKAGQIEPVLEAAPAPVAKPGQYVPPLTKAHWTLQEETSTGAKIICFACPTCKQGGRAVGVRPTPEAVGKVKFWHCGHGEHVPTEIAARYIALNKPAGVMFHPGVQPKPDVALDANLQPIVVNRVLELGTETSGIAIDALAEAEAAYEASLKEAATAHGHTER